MLSPLRAVRDLLAGRKPRPQDAKVALELGWVQRRDRRLRVPLGFHWAARANVFPPLRCPYCEATHFPHSGLDRCAVCRRMLLEPDWQGECPWPLEMEKHRWRTFVK